MTIYNVDTMNRSLIDNDELKELQRLAEIGRQHDKPKEPEIKDGTLCFARDRLTDDVITVLYEHEVMQHWGVNPVPVVTGDIDNVVVFNEHDGSDDCPCDPDVSVHVMSADEVINTYDHAKYVNWTFVAAWSLVPKTGEQE